MRPCRRAGGPAMIYLEVSDETRKEADGFMQAYQQAIANQNMAMAQASDIQFGIYGMVPFLTRENCHPWLNGWFEPQGEWERIP